MSVVRSTKAKKCGEWTAGLAPANAGEAECSAPSRSQASALRMASCGLDRGISPNTPEEASKAKQIKDVPRTTRDEPHALSPCAWPIFGTVHDRPQTGEELQRLLGFTREELETGTTRRVFRADGSPPRDRTVASLTLTAKGPVMSLPQIERALVGLWIANDALESFLEELQDSSRTHPRR